METGWGFREAGKDVRAFEPFPRRRGKAAGWISGGILIQIYGGFVYYMALASFTVAGSLYSLFSFVLRHFLPAKVRGKVGRQTMSWLFRGYVGVLKLTGVVKIDCSELDGLRRREGLVIAPNHPCLIDAVFIISRLPDVVCIMKSSILRNPVLAGGSRLAEFISNDPPLAMVKDSIKALQDGSKLLVFPEGTRTIHPPVNAFQRSFAIIAKAGGAPVQVVYIETNSPCLGKGWSIFKVPRFPLRYRLSLGEEVQVPRDENMKAWVSDLEAEFRFELTGKVVVPESSRD